MTTVRTLLTVGSVRHWSVSQLDVQNVFLNGELREEVICSLLRGILFLMGWSVVFGALFMA
jgi:hypothetical protein